VRPQGTLAGSFVLLWPSVWATRIGESTGLREKLRPMGLERGREIRNIAPATATTDER